MKKLRFIHFLSISSIVAFAGLLSPAISTADGPCPDTWGVQLPPLVLTTNSNVVSGVTRQTLSSSYLGPDDSAKNLHGTPSKDIGGIQGESFALALTMPSLFAKIQALGKNVAWRTFYTSSTKSAIYQEPSYGGEWPAIFQRPASAYVLGWMGLGNGTKMQFNLSIAVNGCQPQTFQSNSATIQGLSETPMTQDSYFSTFGNLFNFQQVDLIKQTIVNDQSLLKDAVLGKNLPRSRFRNDSAGLNFGAFYAGLNPGGCLDGVNTSSAPPIDPLSFTFNAFPCKVGLFAPADFGARGYDWVLIQVDSYTGIVKQTTSPKPAVSPVPSGSSASKLQKTITDLNARLSSLQSQLRKICGAKPKPKGC